MNVCKSTFYFSFTKFCVLSSCWHHSSVEWPISHTSVELKYMNMVIFLRKSNWYNNMPLCLIDKFSLWKRPEPVFQQRHIGHLHEIKFYCMEMRIVLSDCKIFAVFMDSLGTLSLTHSEYKQEVSLGGMSDSIWHWHKKRGTVMNF